MPDMREYDALKRIESPIFCDLLPVLEADPLLRHCLESDGALVLLPDPFELPLLDRALALLNVFPGPSALVARVC